MKTIKVGLIGAGTVGSGLIQIINEKSNVILNRSGIQIILHIGFTVSEWEDIIRLHTRDKLAETPEEAVRIAVMAGIDMSMVS